MIRGGRKIRTRSRKWWNKERIIDALQRFHRDFGYCPTASEDYAKHSEHTGRDPYGRPSNLGWHQKYPSFATVLNHWPTFRQAWKAAGFDIGNENEEWSIMEDWFILESLGVMYREEVAEILGRTAPAVKRRIYDLGEIRAYNRWGITLSAASRLLKVDATVFRKYMECGIIPYFKGIKLIYINPADLLKVEEIDWLEPQVPELDAVIRKAVAQRICKMLKFGTSWRDHEIYKIQKTREHAGRIRLGRKAVFLKDAPQPPNSLSKGDWVRASGKTAKGVDLTDRYGRIESVWFSWQKVKRFDGTRRACWVARVEFPKLRTITGGKAQRIRCTVPLDALHPSEDPPVPPKPASQHQEAVRGRERIAAGEYDRRRKRIRDRLADFI